MSTDKDDLFPSAKDCMRKIAEAESRRPPNICAARQPPRSRKRVDGAIHGAFRESDKEALKRAAAIIQRAVNNGLTEVQVVRFPNTLHDNGRAINQMEPGWENTLTGRPKELFQFWDTHLRPRGYRLRCQIVDWPNGMPGDIGMTLSWQ